MTPTLSRQSLISGLIVLLVCTGTLRAGEFEQLASHAAKYRGNTPVAPQPDGSILVEAEEFNADGKGDMGWRAKDWGDNYYAATFAITFLSRKAFLGAPEQADKSLASIEVDVPKAGKYLALVRYEAAYRFETQFTVKIEQNGTTRLERLYGARKNTKVWAFSNSGGGLKNEVAWYWGAVENVVWEGHDVAVDLAAGRAKITLIADHQPEPAAKRNVDAILLTPDVEDVTKRINAEGYLPLDGLLTQAGDVFLKVQNHADNELAVGVSNGTEHSPYWVHLRQWKPQSVKAPAGQESDWVEVGSLLDTMNDGQWSISASPAAKGGALNYTLKFGVRDATGKIETIASFDDTKPAVPLAYDGNTRYSRRIRRAEAVLDDLMAYLKANPVPGQPLSKTLAYGYTFDPSKTDQAYNARIGEFTKLFALNTRQDGDATFHGMPSGYIDVRGQRPDVLAASLKALVDEKRADNIRVVSLGDEIGLSGAPRDSHEQFRAFLKARGLKPEDLVVGAGDNWNLVVYRPEPEARADAPRLYYYSQLFAFQYGIDSLKVITDLIKSRLPHADTGANFSPHAGAPYLGEAHKYISLFRRGGMTMPWGEDYVWQIPIGSQQMNSIQIDLFRAGNRYNPERDIHMYVMPHWPGNTINGWRRMFYSTLAHGATIINLFEFRPVQAAYTENHVSLPEMYLEVLKGFHELATFEDIVQDGAVRWGNAALWYSETGDAWANHRDPYGANKRSLYIAARHQQLQLDIVDEEDALKGTLKGCKVLYLADANISRAASKVIAGWVRDGGRVFASVGAGMYDEYNEPNKTLQELFGVKHTDVQFKSNIPIHFEKQDLPFAEQIDAVTWKSPAGDKKVPVYGAASVFTAAGAEVIGTFSDGSPAVTINKPGKGEAMFCGFPVGLSYFKPAIPQRPVDRGSSDDAMAHFIPTEFNADCAAIIGAVAQGVDRVVLCSSNLVEATVIESKSGIAIPLVNWSGKPIKGLTVTFTGKAGGKMSLSSGGRVSAKTEGDKTIYTLDLDVADALVLR
ncbi:MAG: beta-galactosidase trimerization domain-containing protein [Planctomycetes bacterium]|nr:beta-galactosidase trimerization domain-containing protein [Planctomycetota bacterium]